MKSRILVLLFFFVITSLLLTSCQTSQTIDASKFNIIFICIDSLRADFLSANGMPDAVSPSLDRLSQRSINFPDVMAQASLTFFSHRAIFLSQYVHAMTRDLPEASETLAGRLRDAGWRTGAFVDGGWMSGHLGHDRGFDTYDDSGGGFTRNIIKAMQFIEKTPQQKFFIFLHGYDVHLPYDPLKEHLEYLSVDTAAPERNRFSVMDPDVAALWLRNRALFKAEARGCDAVLSRFFYSLRKMNRDKDTIIAVFSDHGESLGDHKHTGHGNLYQDQVKIPLLIHIPGCPAIIRPEAIESIDLMPTFLSLLQIPLPGGMQGLNLHLLKPSLYTHPHQRPRLTELTDELFCMDDQWSYIIRDTPEKDELYYLQTDPYETNNLMSSSQEVGKRMQLAYENYTGLSIEQTRGATKEIYKSDMVSRKRLMPARGAEKEIANMEKFEAELKALGYLE